MDINNLFDYIKIFFTDNEKFNSISDKIKEKHFFMLNRFISIKFPLTAIQLSKLNINAIHATNLLHDLMISYKKVPQWIYTPAKSEVTTKKEYLPEEKIINMYCKDNEIGLKELKKAIFFNEKEIKEIEKYYKKLIK